MVRGSQVHEGTVAGAYERQQIGANADFGALEIGNRDRCQRGLSGFEPEDDSQAGPEEEERGEMREMN